MSWLTGTSTWGTLDYDLTRLICGEVAAGNGTTNTTPWVREVTRTVTDLVTNSTTTVTSATASFASSDQGSLLIAAGVPANTTIASVTNSTTAVLSAAATATASGVSAQICTNTIRTPASKDVASGAMSNRTGYFSFVAISSGTSQLAGGTQYAPVCRVTSPFTTDPSTSGFHRWVVRLAVNTANTVAGNYSTAALGYAYTDLDSGVTLLSSSVSVNAAGVAILPNGLQVTLSDPSGILPVNAMWVRGFTSTYLYGVDLWPMLYRQGASAPTFSVAPPGVAGTDYDIVSIPYGTSANIVSMFDRGNVLHGLGVKTATANTGALYTVSHPMALIKARIFNNPTTAGVLSLDLGQSKKDPVNSLSTYRAVGGYRITTWAKAWQTAVSVTTASAVQYFLSVTADGITLALNADPGQTGKLGTAVLAAFTPTDPTYDVFPVAVNPFVLDYTADMSSDWMCSLAVQYPYWSLRRRQDGSEGRDWQTRWMRAEHLYNSAMYAGTSGTDIVSMAPETSSGGAMNQLFAVGAGITASNNTYLPARQNKPAPDGKWWLYGFQYGETSAWSGGAATQQTVDENRFIRGQQIARYVFIPETGWGSGDELTDTSTGTKYLLLVPDYAGLGSRIRTAASTFWGGVAIAEL